MQKRHGSSQAEIPVQLPLQEGHEEGEELPAHLLEHVPELAGYVAKRRTPGSVWGAGLPPSSAGLGARGSRCAARGAPAPLPGCEIRSQASLRGTH